MPTPVSLARQCLTPEAAQAIDEAVGIARRRGNSQTTSLHAVSALLSLPSSGLRDACARSRNAAYSARLQLKALDLCLNVSLERVPSGQPGGDPPISNSLMAAIKRSQANQRRQPENFHLYRDISQQNASSISLVKVELQNLILSILDDPVVSRVFGEAGFRSPEIKLAIIRPLPSSLLRYSRTRGPPVFLCNLEDPRADSRPDRNPGSLSFRFPFTGFAPLYGDNHRRIEEVLARRRTPLLLGVCAYNTLTSFIQCIELRKGDILDEEISTLNVFSIEKDVSKCANGGFDPGCLESSFEEMGRVLDQDLGPGLLVNFGDLKLFLGESKSDSNDNGLCSEDAMSSVIAKLTRLLKVHVGKVLLIGAAESNEIYSKFVYRFPSVEKEWDLQILPITSLRPSFAESYPRSSLMESFVPFGGFFPTPSELNQPVPRCNLCNEKCEQEVIAVSDGDFSASVADHYRYSLSSWLQMAELSNKKGSDPKIRDDGVVSSTKVAAVQKKWDSICQHLHHSHSFRESYSSQRKAKFPAVFGFEFTRDKIEVDDSPCSENHQSNSLHLNSHVLPDSPKTSASKSGTLSPTVSKSKSGSLQANFFGKPSRDNHINLSGPRSPCSLSNSSVVDGSRASFVSNSSVMTDLSLAISSIPSGNKLETTTNQNYRDLGHTLSGSLPGNGEKKINSAQSSSSSSPEDGEQFDPSDFKKLLKAIKGRIGRQDEAAEVVSHTVARCRTRTYRCHGAGQRGDIWLNFKGSDRCGKIKFAAALADTLYGSRDNVICVDLSSQDGTSRTHSIFKGWEVNHDLRFWGKTVVDYIAEELGKRPLSVVFLENVDKADMLLQSHLSQAIRTGKFSDSHGREVNTNGATFVTTSTLTQDSEVHHPRPGTACYSEDRILEAKGWPIKIVVECVARNGSQTQASSVAAAAGVGLTDPGFLNKRKLMGTNEVQHEIKEMAKRANMTFFKSLDLNVPAEDNEVVQMDDGYVENDSVSENSKHWFQQFVGQVHANVYFKPFDFDALARMVVNDISESFRKFISTECSIEIDSDVMDQLLAATCLSDGNGAFEDWVEQVLRRGFTEVGERYKLTAESVVRLVTDEGCNEEIATGFHLPSKVTVC